MVALSQDPAATSQTLAGFLNDEPSPFLIAGTGVREGKLAFVFSGNGAQFTGMGRNALRSNAAFRRATEDLDRMLRPELGWSITPDRARQGIATEAAKASPTPAVSR